MESGVAGRNMVSLTNPNRARMPEFGSMPINDDDERPAPQSHGLGASRSAGWASIWNDNNTPLGSGFPRESSRPRGSQLAPRRELGSQAAENGIYTNCVQDGVEGKTGSGSLVASSESDAWNMQRTPWDTNSTLPHSRSGVSPARKRAQPQPQPSQPHADAAPANAFFSGARTNTLSQGTPSKPLLDPTISNFSSMRSIEPAGNGSFLFGRMGDSDAIPLGTNSAWDNSSMPSPTDDRRSVAASEYFGAPSATQSRSGSLPPSRHGDPLQFSQNGDAYSRYPQPVTRGHNPSFSSQTNGRAYQQERSGSVQSETIALLGRMSLTDTQGMTVHRPSMSVNGVSSQFNLSAQNIGHMRDAIPDMSQALVRADEPSLNGIGSFASEYANGHLGDHVAQLRAYQFGDTRSAPNGTGVRQSPYYSQTHTPATYDHLYPSHLPRADQIPRVVSNTNIPILEKKLRVHAQIQQQEQQAYVNSQHFQPQHFQQMIPNNSFRTPYLYGIPNGLPVNGMHAAMALPAIHGILPGEPPKAPRDHESAEGYRSVLLQQFKQNNKTTKRYELKDIYEHIVEFSGDQHGSRFIQQKLETANSDEKERVFKELQPNSLQLMQDVFGNYVIQKFFEHGDQNQKRILANRMKGHVVVLSVQMYACRVVQKALEHILTDQQAVLVRELEKDVIRCVKDQNGNHVIQKVIERVPPEHLDQTIQAFKGQVGFLATHTYGCRVIQRLLEHCEEPARSSILEELHYEGAKLIPDQYGNYVTQHIIEHGRQEDRAKITALIKNELAFFSKHKFASNVVEKCLVYGTDEQRREIMLKTLEDDERGERVLMVLLKDGYGNYVIQKLLDTLCPKDFSDFLEHLQPEMAKAKRIIPGKQIQAVEKKMHRLDRFDTLPGMIQRNSVGSATRSTDISAAPTPPPLVNDAQSPQSCSLPSTHSSTVGPEELIHTTTSKDFTPPHAVDIANAS